MRGDPIERRRQARRRSLLVRLAILCAACVLVCVAVGVVAVTVIRRTAAPSAKQMALSPQSAPPGNAIQPIRFYLSAENTNDFQTFPQYRGKSAVVLLSSQFNNEFQSNELKAINTYRGQRFYISGYTSALSVDGETTTLTLGDVGFGAVYCKCSSRDVQLLKVRATPRFASSVLLEGTCEHATTFKDCRVVEIRTPDLPDQKGM